MTTGSLSKTMYSPSSTNRYSAIASISRMSSPPAGTANPFYTVQPQPTWYTLIKNASDAVPVAKPEAADKPSPWTLPPAATARIGPPARDWPAEADPQLESQPDPSQVI